MISWEDIFSETEKAIRKHSGLPHDVKVNGDDRFNDLGLDSLDFIDVVMDLEKGFSVTVTDDEAYSCETVKQMVNLFSKKVNA